MEDAAVSPVLVLTGTYTHNMDSKGRINFPAKLRDQLGKSFVISRSLTQHCLMVHPVENWRDLERQLLSAKGPRAEMMARRLFSSATEVTPDQQGRILIPAALRKYAGLDSEEGIVIAGVGRKVEIWRESAWEELNLEPTEEDDTELLNNFSL